METLYLAMIDTRRYEFSALGKTKAEAEGAVKKGYKAWEKAYPGECSPVWRYTDGTVASPTDDIQVTEYRIGVPLMDREEMEVK
tara:strand:- start:224 stop:475 length:252 start_codon:yes stop_codon:yes gene_type:complete